MEITPTPGGASLLASAVLWFAATRGKHVGWLGFLLAAGLAWFGA